MTDYPEDVMKAAREALRVQTRMRDWPGQGDRLAEIDRGEWDKGFACRAAAQAILAERERCAKVADARGWAASRRPVMSHDEHRHDMADEIAAAIRGGSNA